MSTVHLNKLARDGAYRNSIRGSDSAYFGYHKLRYKVSLRPAVE
jgi:hypothetical protein